MLTLPGVESALNLTLRGSVGSFCVGDRRTGQHTVDVRYLLTHVGLDFSFGSDESVLQILTPVREAFDVDQLDVGAFMHASLNDARVSSELIPYLLDVRAVDRVKLFPPIVVVVLPAEPGERVPPAYYPKVDRYDKPAGDGTPPLRVVRSGEVGNEVFQLEHPIQRGQAFEHDLVRLRLNTHRSRLVIVDGQHRAMALLALYRNLKGEWSDAKRAPFKEYYAEWTPDYIGQFNLDKVSLPMMLCTFPQLDTTYTGDLDLVKAARLIFLTLNKTARKVSNARNILLDDNDLIALFLRACFSVIKGKGPHSSYALRIHNVELDQTEDKIKLSDPVAVTGVNHIHYVIEHLMLNRAEEDVNGARARSGRFDLRKDLEDNGLMSRLDGRNALGHERARATKRDLFANAAAETLSERFMQRYGTYVVHTFERFEPYEYHNKAAIDLQKDLDAAQDRRIQPILFEGQGIGKVFERHRKNLEEKLKDDFFGGQSPEVRAVLDRLNGTAKRLEKAVADLRAMRADYYLGNLGATKRAIQTESGAWHETVTSWLDTLYADVYKSVAFQSALICGFFEELERVRRPGVQDMHSELAVDALFADYMDQLNAFFVPQTVPQLRRLVGITDGEMDEDDLDQGITPSNQTFREVAFRGEMKPDEWPKYRYLLLEVWHPSDPEVAASVAATRNLCRQQLFAKLHSDNKSAYAKESLKLEEDLTDDELQNIFGRSYEAYTGFLRKVFFLVDRDTAMPTKTDFRNMLAGQYAPEA